MSEEPRVMSDHEALMENTRIMRQIVAEMKEIPELPSEVPKDINPLQKVEFPGDGGVLTYMEGYEYPYKGFPFFEFVDKIDTIKKTQRAVLSSLYHSLKRRPKWQLLGLIFVPWLFGDVVRAFIYTFHRTVDRFKLKPIRYCTAMRELYRVCSIEWHEENPRDREIRLMLRDILCMLLEFDNAYRFRFQDVIVELDKNNLQKNPSKEILRLLEVMMSREATQEIKDTWSLVRFFLPLYIRFNKPLRRGLVGVLSEIDVEKLRLAPEDKQYCLKRKDYKFSFMN